MKAVVFGGTGFIGSHVVEQLVLAEHQVIAVVRKGSNTHHLDALNVTVKRIDFDSDEEIVESISGSDVVFNCLANPKQHQSPEAHRAVEVKLTQRVFLCAVRASAKRFVQLSTVMVYGFGRPAEPINEEFPCSPTYLFNQVAFEREQILREAAAEEDLELVMLRPSNCTGRRDASFLPPYILMHKLRLFPAFGSGMARFSCIDARDAGRAMVWLGQLENIDGDTYLAKGYDLSWLELKQALDQFFGRKAFLFKTPVSVARFFGRLMERLVPYGRNPQITPFAVDVLTTTTLFNDSKIRNSGFQPIYTLQDTLIDAG